MSDYVFTGSSSVTWTLPEPCGTDDKGWPMPHCYEDDPAEKTTVTTRRCRRCGMTTTIAPST